MISVGFNEIHYRKKLLFLSCQSRKGVNNKKTIFSRQDMSANLKNNYGKAQLCHMVIFLILIFYGQKQKTKTYFCCGKGVALSPLRIFYILCRLPLIKMLSKISNFEQIYLFSVYFALYLFDFFLTNWDDSSTLPKKAKRVQIAIAEKL